MNIYCANCEHQCSEKAPACPRCGHPLQETLPISRRIGRTVAAHPLLALGACATVVLGVLLIANDSPAAAPPLNPTPLSISPELAHTLERQREIIKGTRGLARLITDCPGQAEEVVIDVVASLITYKLRGTTRKGAEQLLFGVLDAGGDACMRKCVPFAYTLKISAADWPSLSLETGEQGPSPLDPKLADPEGFRLIQQIQAAPTSGRLARRLIRHRGGDPGEWLKDHCPGVDPDAAATLVSMLVAVRAAGVTQPDAEDMIKIQGQLSDCHRRCIRFAYMGERPSAP